ncbi:hypothetical protein M758_10G096500 [Ceratodon purpureus]|nr:hypothetical protein M758_10G096500 [Ceratodon purpureus]
MISDYSRSENRFIYPEEGHFFLKSIKTLPRYCNTEFLSTKSDIYSFGVVLLELLTGRPPIDRSGLNQNPKPGICDWTRSTLEDGNIDAILAPEVRASKPRPNTEALWKVTEIALQCVEPLSMYRPTMTVVLQELHQAIGMEEAASPMGSSGVFAYSGGSELGPMAR